MSIEEINRLWKRVAPRVERAAAQTVRRAERLLAGNRRTLEDAAVLLALLPAAVYAHLRRRGL